VRTAALALVLCLAVAAVFGRAVGHEFVSFDDGVYVTKNEHVRAGIGIESLRWAATSFEGGSWHPLTWLSHLLDVELFGLAPAGHHATSVLLHAATTLVLLLALHALSGSLWPSAFATALFALHPLRAESVAWVAERKDVVAGLGFVLALLAYARYVRRPSAGRLAGVALAMTAALLAKPSVVTLPFVLLLLDVWPLRRLDLFARPFPGRRLVALCTEKLPLFGLAVGASALSLVAQAAIGAVTSLEAAPLAMRVANALLAYAAYLRMSVWPTELAFFYPYPKQLPWAELVGAAALLVSLTALAFAQLRRRPWLAVGWLWFLGVLVPMIGLVQVGAQAHADRYSYLPSIGLAVAFAWSVAEGAGRWPRARRGIALGAALLVVASAAATWRQVGTWRDDRTLYVHALAVTRDNFKAAANLAWLLATSPDPEQRDAAAALRFAGQAAELTAYRNPNVLDTLAAAHAEAGRFADAVDWQRRAIRLAPPGARQEFVERLALYQTGRPYREPAP
jgi:hypothetical protein